MHKSSRQLVVLVLTMVLACLSIFESIAQEDYPLPQLEGIWDMEWTHYQRTASDSLVKSATPVDNTVVSFEKMEESNGMNIKNYLRSRGAEYLLSNTICFHDAAKNETHTLSSNGKGIITYPSSNIIVNTQYDFAGSIRFISRIYHKTDTEIIVSVEPYRDNKPTEGLAKAVGLKRLLGRGAVQLRIPTQ